MVLIRVYLFPAPLGQYCCEVCQETFTQRYNLDRHLARPAHIYFAESLVDPSSKVLLIIDECFDVLLSYIKSRITILRTNFRIQHQK